MSTDNMTPIRPPSGDPPGQPTRETLVHFATSDEDEIFGEDPATLLHTVKGLLETADDLLDGQGPAYNTVFAALVLLRSVTDRITISTPPTDRSAERARGCVMSATKQKRENPQLRSVVLANLDALHDDFARQLAVLKVIRYHVTDTMHGSYGEETLALHTVVEEIDDIYNRLDAIIVKLAREGTPPDPAIAASLTLRAVPSPEPKDAPSD